MWNSSYIPASFWLCKWKTIETESQAWYHRLYEGKIAIWIEWQILVREETTGQSLKYLPLPTLMFKHSNASMRNMPLQASWKAKCLYFNCFVLKATLLYCFKLNSKVSIRNLCLVLLQWSPWQYFFCFEYLIGFREIPGIFHCQYWYYGKVWQTKFSLSFAMD